MNIICQILHDHLETSDLLLVSATLEHNTGKKAMDITLVSLTLLS